MTLRTFTSHDGAVWNVWNVVPTLGGATNALAVAEGMAGGWLCFESPAGKRRVFPVPEGWEEWSEEELERCLLAAPPVQPRAPRAPPPDPAPADAPAPSSG